MIDDHSEAQNKLQDMMKGNDQSTAPKTEEKMSMMNKLQNASGTDLDQQYMSMMVQDHQKDLDALKNAQASVQNPELKDYIQNLIPVVQKHLDKAQDIENSMAKTETH
jgi:putative membrane protein